MTCGSDSQLNMRKNESTIQSQTLHNPLKAVLQISRRQLLTLPVEAMVDLTNK